VLVLLALAGLLRPGGVGAGRPVLAVGGVEGDLARALQLRGAGRDRAAGVGGTDLIVTGDPLFSLHLHELLGRGARAPAHAVELPSAVPQFFTDHRQAAGAVAALLGLAIGVSLARATADAARLLAAGLATFVMIGIAGASVIERYLVVAAWR
jgi:hypothetical protein